MSTSGIEGHDGCHYSVDGYKGVAEWIFGMVGKNFYGYDDTAGVTPPDIQKAYYTSEKNNEVALKFDQPVVWPEDDTLGHSLKDYIHFDTLFGIVDSVYSRDGDSTWVMVLGESIDAEAVFYPPAIYYPDSGKVFQGPWLKNERGIGVLAFVKKLASSSNAVRPSAPLPAASPGSFRCAIRSNTLVVFALSRQPSSIRLYTIAGKSVGTYRNVSLPCVHISLPPSIAENVFLVAVEYGDGVRVVRAVHTTR
jgi:hypothetical protein